MIESSTIFKFELPFGMGVAYCKIVNFQSISLYYGITIKVFDYFEDVVIKDVEIFRGMPLFMNPIPIVKMPTLRGKFAWKKLGVLIEESDKNIPIYKRYVNEGFAWESLPEYKSREWNAFVDLKDKIGPP